MIGMFGKTKRIAYMGGALAGLLGFGLGWLVLAGRPAGNRALIAGLVALVAVSMVVYFARIEAGKRYQLIMALLYTDLDPHAFLEVAQPLLAHKMPPVQYVTTKVHISNGWLAAGRPERALAVLDELTVPPEATALLGLVSANRATCYLELGRTVEAKRAMEETKAIISRKDCKKDFALKARHTLAFQRLHLAVVQKHTVDVEALRKDFEASRAPLHKVKAAALLMQAYRLCGDEAAFCEMREYILENGGKLAAVEKARAVSF